MRRFVLFGVVVASLVLLPNAMGVAQDGENVLLHEDFEGKEKKDTWEVLESDVGNGYGVTKGFLNAFGALNWQFRMPFTKQLPPGRLAGAVQFEFRYRIDRSKDDQSFLVGLGWMDGLVVERAATVALNAGNLGINEELKGTGGTDNTPLLLREWTAGTVDFEVRSLEATPERNWAKLQSDSIALVDDVWVFLAGTYDGADQKIYVNSKLDGTLANPGGYTNNDLMLRIGWDPHAEDRHYVGVIDEVAIYDRALTPNEIVQNQNASLGITSVDPAGKLSSTWGEIKAGY